MTQAIRRSMDDIDPDTLMVVAGVTISLFALLEIYSNWKNARKDRSP